ncbi:MAG: hypothetical protein HZB16_10855 [Armatimonadetes bacterium]|nr:hypothetical protein [Armatimonadota bacterium]
MHAPTMQHEWHRRQAQRSVIALLGLLAVFSHAPAAVVLGSASGLPGASIVRTIDAAPAAKRAEAVTAQPAPTRYWSVVRAAADGSARLTLALHAEARPTVPESRRFLSRFWRPPTI